MIYGIEAAAERLGASGSTPGVAGLIFDLDFIAGSYSNAGESIAVSTIIDKPELITGSGLHIVGSSGTGMVTITGSLNTLLLTADWSLVCEVDLLNSTASKDILSIENTGASQYIWLFSQYSNGRQAISDTDGSVSRFPYDNYADYTGVHKFSATETADHAAISINGNAAAAESGTVSYSGLNLCRFGCYPGATATGAELYIRKFQIYSTRTDEQLAVLSA